MKVFNKILIANRGEIALRIIRTLKSMNINSVAVYNYSDKDSDFVKAADEAYLLSGNTLAETYLNIEKIIKIALDSQTEAIHPGYGFLSENPEFSKKVSEHGLNFIGPTSDVIRLMGDKEAARKIAVKSELTIIEGVEGKGEKLFSEAKKLAFPLLVKASAGGGGKAMRVAENEEQLKEAISTTSREAMNYFGNSSLIIEKYLKKARHIEVQVLADHYGKCIILGDRECTIQRRHQKVIEEAPAPGIKEETRNKLHQVSQKLVESIDYINAGTIEYLLDDNENFYFLEMNTRIQVEHPVTETVTGIDIVKEQVLISAGNKLKIKQEDIRISGHSIEARLYAENPEKEFLPSPGSITYYEEPINPGLRIDSAISGPSILSPDFDPMIAKIIVHGDNRNDAILELRKSLLNFKIAGLNTNREFLAGILNNKEYIQNQISTRWLESKRLDLLKELNHEKNSINSELVIFAWALKKFENKILNQDSVWKNIGKWRQLNQWQLMFRAEERKICVKNAGKGFIIVSIDNIEFKLNEVSVENEKVRFLYEGNIFNAVVINGIDIEDLILINGYEFSLRPFDYLPKEAFIKETEEQDSIGPRIIKSPLHGRIVKLNANMNGFVSKGDLLMTLDAMKIENKILSPSSGLVKKIYINEGDQVHINQNLIEIEYKKEAIEK